MSRIVVTGAGVICAIGAGVDDFEQSLFSARCGITPGTFPDDPEACTRAGQIQNFTPQQWLGPKGIRVLDRSARLLCVAAHLALCSSGLAARVGEEGDPNIGLVCGTMFGSVHSITSFDWSGLVDGPNYVNPMEFPNTVINSPAGQAAIKYKLRGINSTVSAGLASGLYAIHCAAEFLRLGRATVLLAGGVEELCQESYLGFQKMGFASAQGKPLPFSPERDGTVLGEGSALLMLETEESARGRGVEPLAEIRGFGSAHDAHSIDGYRVQAEGATSAMRQALEDASIAPEQIGLIVASANGSRMGDAMEGRALRNVFGDRLAGIPVCAPKAGFGEVLGASGALLALTGVLALRRQLAPPTCNALPGDEALRLSDKAELFEGKYVLVNSFSCDGNNAALVLARCSHQ